MKVRMRFIALALSFMAGPAFAAAPIPNFDPAVFEKRFNKADKGKKGRLTRAEAYAEFPRMPEFFDEIDTNKDGYITLAEVRQAMDRRVNAAMDTSKTGKRYGLDADSVDTVNAPAAKAQQPKQFSSDAAARHYYENQYYDSLTNSKPPQNLIINKSF